MLWFIASEVMFFAAFFGALFYARAVSVPWLAGAGDKLETHLLLWPDFADTWPLFITPGGTTTQAMEAWGLPFINTVILVSSSGTITFAHWALQEKSARTPETVAGRHDRAGRDLPDVAGRSSICMRSMSSGSGWDRESTVRPSSCSPGFTAHT